MNNKFSMSPPKANNKDADSFIMSAEKDLIESLKPAKIFPWEHPYVREDVIKIFNIRLTEPYMLKLAFLAKVKRVPRQKICVEAVMDIIDKMLEEI